MEISFALDHDANGWDSFEADVSRTHFDFADVRNVSAEKVRLRLEAADWTRCLCEIPRLNLSIRDKQLRSQNSSCVKFLRHLRRRIDSSGSPTMARQQIRRDWLSDKHASSAGEPQSPHVMGGIRSAQGRAASKAAAARKMSTSLRALEMTCKPTGKPSLVKPIGKDAPGLPVRLNG